MAIRKSNHIIKREDIDFLINIKESDITLSFLIDLFGEFDNKSRFRPYDTFDIPIGSYGKNNKKNKNICKTTVGIWIFNKYFIEEELFYIFGYVNEEIDSSKLKKMSQTIANNLAMDRITIDEYERFLLKTQKVMPLTTITSHSHTDKFLQCSREIEKRKKVLAKQYAKEIEAGDPAIAEKMEKELLDFTKEYLKDDPSLDLYLSGARSSLGNHFKNMYIMKGAIRNMDPNAEKEYDIVLSNYNDGISRDDYVTMAKSLSPGPYARAKKTAVGGHWEKLFVAYQYLKVDKKGSDCGTTDTIEVLLTEKNYMDWIYSYIKVGSNYEALTPDNCAKFINRTVSIRFSALCETKDKFCNKCIGDLPYILGVENIGTYMPKVPASLKLLSMKKFHVSVVKMQKLDINKIFGL